jgi:AbrB family looped-hinge helix DNA binding protein
LNENDKFEARDMMSSRTRVSRGGRVVIPVEYRRALGIGEGDEIIISLDDGQLRIVTPQHAIEDLQRIVRQFVPEGISLADELIAERRREAERE